MTKGPAKNTAASLIYNAGGRRFLLALLALASASLLAWFAKISGDAYAISVVGVVGAFVAGVTAQRIKGAP